MMSEMCRWPVATSSRPHLPTSNRVLFLYITPASYWTVGFLHQSHCLCPWSTGGIWRGGLSLNGRQTVVGDEKIAPPPPILPTLPSASSPIDMWRRKSWLIFVQRHFSTVCGTDWHVQLSTTSCKLISRSMRRAAPLSSNTIYQYKYKDNTNTSTIQRSALVLKWSDLIWIARCTSLLTFIWLLTNPICFLWPYYCSRSWCRWICDKVQLVHVRTLGMDRF